MKTVEVAGTVDNEHQIHTDDPLPFDAATRVWVTIRYAEEGMEFAKQMEIAKRVMAEDRGLLERLAE